jgi:hypothetical protein
LVQERSAEINRLQKTLEGANVRLGDIAADQVGPGRVTFTGAQVCN